MFDQPNTPGFGSNTELLSYHCVSEFKLIYPIKLNYKTYPGPCVSTHTPSHTRSD